MTLREKDGPLCLQNGSERNDITINKEVVIFTGILVGISLFKTLDILKLLHLFGDYYA